VLRNYLLERATCRELVQAEDAIHIEQIHILICRWLTYDRYKVTKTHAWW